MSCDELPCGLSRSMAHSLSAAVLDVLLACRLFPLAVNLHTPFINGYFTVNFCVFAFKSL